MSGKMRLEENLVCCVSLHGIVSPTAIKFVLLLVDALLCWLMTCHEFGACHGSWSLEQMIGRVLAILGP
jgi:hypothetical protein